MLRFTRDLVHYARPSGGVAGPVVLHGVIDQAAAFCEHVLAGASMRWSGASAPRRSPSAGVSEQLVQVFVNLLTNASQAAPRVRGLVVVRRRSTPRPAGCGCSSRTTARASRAEHLAQVFAPFFTTKGDKHGTGLGLSIVKSIVEGHDGDIRVESAPGQGTRFAIELPAWQRPA